MPSAASRTGICSRAPMRLGGKPLRGLGVAPQIFYCGGLGVAPQNSYCGDLEIVPQIGRAGQGIAPRSRAAKSQT